VTRAHIIIAPMQSSLLCHEARPKCLLTGCVIPLGCSFIMPQIMQDSGELLPYQIRLYQYYRDQALRTLDRGSTVINTNDLSFLKSDSDTMAKVATELVLQRDRKIFQLEQVGADRAGLGQMQAAFKANSKEATQKIKAKDFRVSPNSMDRIGRIADVVKTIAVVGCVVM
jgi:hypothetical protein